jgi:hypothetical protein
MGTNMQTPPPYYAGAPKKSNTGIIVAVVVGVIALCCLLPAGVLTFFGMGVFNNAKGFLSCGWTLQQVRDGMVAYAKAHHDMLPPKENWEEAIKPYLQPLPQAKGIEMPAPGSGTCDLQNKSGYSYNADLAGKKLSSIKNPSETIVVWEVNSAGHDQSASYTEPAEGTGPNLVGNIKRGWVVQPLDGPGYFISQKGARSYIPPPGQTDVNIDDNNGNVDVKTPGSEVKVKSGTTEIHTTGG